MNLREALEHLFTSHLVDEEQLVHIDEVREAGRAFAEVIARHTEPGMDRAQALQYVRMAVMLTNGSIACGTDAVTVANSSYGEAPLQPTAMYRVPHGARLEQLEADVADLRDPLRRT